MRLVPALALLLIAPFTGELLLGNLPPDPASWAFMLIPLVLLYGGGALLIRRSHVACIEAIRPWLSSPSPMV